MTDRYDLIELSKANDKLQAYVKEGPKGLTIDFSDAQAVKQLNKALLMFHFNVSYWDFPDAYLCPPITGRMASVDAIAQVLSNENKGRTPKGHKVSGLDIGTGASLIYPILASKEYGWTMIASEIDPEALESGNKILEENTDLQSRIDLKEQENKDNFFKRVISKEDHIDFSMCNPPYFADIEEASKANQRKNKNLHEKKNREDRNFGGKHHELVYPGGEKNFIFRMIEQSRSYGNNIMWFSCLVSNKSLLPALKSKLKHVEAESFFVKDLSIGKKKSRMICWSFLNEKQRSKWVKIKWT